MDIKYLQKLLNIENVELNIIKSVMQSEEGICYTNPNMHKAEIRIKQQLSNDEETMTLIHEMIHVMQRHECNIVYKFIEDERVLELYNEYNEEVVEDLANAIYQLINK